LLPAAAPAQSPWTTETHLELRGRYEDRNNRDIASSVDDLRQDGLLRLRLELTVRNPETGLSAFLQPQASVDAYSVPNRDGTYDRTSIHQAYVQWQKPADKRLIARIGRQELAYGNQRLVGAFAWDNVGRSFDGVRADYQFDIHALSAFGVRLGDAANRAQTPKLYGLYDTTKLRPGPAAAAHTVDAYLLHKRDSVQGATQKVTTFGVRSDFSAKSGWGYLAEVALQTGRTSGKDLSAWAYSVSAGQTLPGIYKPRLSVEYNAASGGDPANPDKAHTFDQLFPTNHDKYGIIDYQGWRNMRNLRVGASARLPNATTAGLDYHWFWLQNARDFWYGAAGQPNRGPGGITLRDATGQAGKTVGQELDLSATWPVNPALQVSGGYARFMPGSFVERVTGQADPSNWWYLQASYRK
jgi:hypothetical protein